MEPASRDKAGRFVKGVSGNPKGRPKTPDEFKQLARDKSYDALLKIVDIMENPDKYNARASDIVNAVKEIIDRAYGKPVQEVESHNINENNNINQNIDLSHLSTDEIKELLENEHKEDT